MKGLELARRDNSGLLRGVMKQLIEILMKQFDRALDKCTDLIKSVCAKTLAGETDLSALVVSKSIAKSFKSYTGTPPAVVQLAKRMEDRDPGNGPREGDRVNFVRIQGASDAKLADLIEPPLYALEHNLPLDYNWYVAKQLAKPISRLMYYPLKSREPKTRTLFDVGVFRSKEDKELAPEDAEHKTLAKKARMLLSKDELKKLEAKEARKFDKVVMAKASHLFVPDLIKIRKERVQLTSPSKVAGQATQERKMGHFAHRIGTCLGCKASLPRAEDTICSDCKPLEVIIWKRNVERCKQLQNETNDLWDICRRCKGYDIQPSLHDGCANADCGNFWVRQTRLRECTRQMEVNKLFQKDLSW